MNIMASGFVRRVAPLLCALAAALPGAASAQDRSATGRVAPEDVTNLLSQFHGAKTVARVDVQPTSSDAVGPQPVAGSSGVAAAAGKPPKIAAIYPNPMAGSADPQILTIEGRDFVYGSLVKLHDETFGRNFELGSAVTHGGAQLVTSANVGTRAADWSLEIVNPDGGSSGLFGFHVTPKEASGGPIATARELARESRADTSSIDASPSTNRATDSRMPVPVQSSPLPNSNAFPNPSKAAQGAEGAGASPKAPMWFEVRVDEPPSAKPDAHAYAAMPAAHALPIASDYRIETQERLPEESTRLAMSETARITGVQDVAYTSGAGEGDSAAVDPAMEYGGSRSLTVSDQLVRPEVTTAIVVSNRDVNRVACQDSVQDAYWSQERPVKVSISGSNVFVKFLIHKLGEKYTFVADPVDLHVVCSDAVYTMVLHPQQMDSVTVRLVAPVEKAVKKLTKDWSALPLEEKIQRFTLMLYKNEFAEGFERKPVPSGDPRRNRRLLRGNTSDTVPGVGLTAKYEVIGNGTGLKATEYSVVPDRAREFRETDFLSRQFGDVVGVTVDPLRVEAGKPARLIVVTRSVEHGS